MAGFLIRFTINQRRLELIASPVATTLTMNPFFRTGLLPGAVRTLDPSPSLRADLSALYSLSQASAFVFASPIGPFDVGALQAFLPRFVFFGPHACDESWRLAFLAGFDHSDLRASRALVALATRLATDSGTGHALNLTFFPVVDIEGLTSGVTERGLADTRWGVDAPPEIRLLEQDARQRGYHGFVRLETAAPGQEVITLRIRGARTGALSPDLGLLTHEVTHSFEVRLEASGSTSPEDGPLSLDDGLPIAPFELTLRIPSSWSDKDYQRAAVTLLERFLKRYRAFQAYGQHL
jgi:hypothetical protein